ncbi:MAG: alpha-L-fucosidase [Fimbriimonas sp.]|nr:alpha-L-fucosidase [Fimbriimonas sp.]
MIISNPSGPFEPTWDSLERYQVPEWYLDAKFGIFIHWGLYCVPAFGNEWYPRNMYVQGSNEFEHHVKTYGSQDQFGYKDFIPMFKAEKFDADEWVKLFDEAGAKFVVPVAEHHDGFAMYKTKSNKWNAAEMGPERDIVGELATATRKRNLTFGVSSHRIEHWWFMNGGRDFTSDVQDPAFAEFYGPATPGNSDFGKNPPSEPFMDDWLLRCAELIDNYRPQLFWFDWWIEQPVMAPYLRRFASYYYNRAHAWGQGVAVNYKNEAFPEKAAVYDVERGQLADIRARFWQTDTAVAKNSWGYIDGMDYKTSESIIHDLVDIVSKNGALLLNIGPRADGTIPEGDQAILRDIGAWLKVNGEAIYGTRPWKVYGEGPTRVETGAFTDTNRQQFGPKDIRFTQKDGVLFATVLSAAMETVSIRSLGSHHGLEPRTVARVETMTGVVCAFERKPEALAVQLPDSLDRKVAVTLKVVFE